MAAKHCNLSLASIWFGGTYELDPWVRCWWPVLAWCTGWFELAGMQYQGSLISWFRIARGIPRETVGHEGRHNQTCPRYELDRVWLLLHLRLRPDLPHAYSLSKSPLWITCHMITERSSHGIITSGLWICHTRETSELCALVPLLPAPHCLSDRDCPSHYTVRVLLSFYDDDGDDLLGNFVFLLLLGGTG